jgi:hypothetical protein
MVGSRRNFCICNNRISGTDLQFDYSTAHEAYRNHSIEVKLESSF